MSSGSQWASGGNNQYPSKQATVSSYTALDQILLWFNNVTMYPNLKRKSRLLLYHIGLQLTLFPPEIVVAGHSLGAQMTQRYAMVGTQLGLRGIWLAIVLTYALTFINQSR
jgi:hypothetical protein